LTPTAVKKDRIGFNGNQPCPRVRVTTGPLFDPICVAVRAIGLGILPALQYASSRGLGFAQTLPNRSVQHGADTMQDVLSQVVWTSKQGYFHQTWFIVVLFVAVIFLGRLIFLMKIIGKILRQPSSYLKNRSARMPVCH
jgi:hypothetical protein